MELAAPLGRRLKKSQPVAHLPGHPSYVHHQSRKARAATGIKPCGS